jgi:site-specific DNA-methyltransferase (adenine-specific)
MPYFKEKNFELHHSDCVEWMGTYEENSIDMIFADPPYNLSNGGITCHSGKMVSVNKGRWDVSKGIYEDFEFHKNWISGCRRILKPSGTLWVSGTYHSIYACGFAMQSLGFHFLNDIAWFKPNAPPNLSCRFFTASHETIIWARKDKGAKHKFNYQQMKKYPQGEDFLKKPNKQMRSVWSIPPPKQTEKSEGRHTTQKPESLLRRIIVSCSDKGDIVLDPFNGSGTTGLVAYGLGRPYIGIDTEKKFLDLTVRRFQKLLSAKETSDDLF